MNFLFSFKGRIGRLAWWGGQLIIVTWFIVACLLFVVVTGASLGGATQLTDLQKASVGASAILFIIAALVPAIWVSAATSVKRFHDRDKSGLWFLIVFAPYIGSVWLTIECGFLSGTPGGNSYGNRGDNHSGWSPDEFSTQVEGHNNLDDLIQQRLLERQQEQNPSVQNNANTELSGNGNALTSERPVFGRRT